MQQDLEEMTLRDKPTANVTTLSRHDFALLLENIKLDCTDRTRPLLLIRTIQGHAQCGHGAFAGYKPYPNMTIEKAVEANMDTLVRLGYPRDLMGIKVLNQQYIDDITSTMRRLLNGEDISYLVNRSGQPLGGINMLKEHKVSDPSKVLLGLYLGTRMDNYPIWRRKVGQKHPGFEMGGGICCAVDVKRLERAGFDLQWLSQREYIDTSNRDLQYLIGLEIVNINETIRSSNGWRSGYVRMRQGYGVSDDAAVIMAGLLYGKDAAMGLLLADAIDTWDKFVPEIIPGGQDELFGNVMEQTLNIEKDLGVTEDDVVNFIYLASIQPLRHLSYADSSQRYFLQVDPRTGVTALESHMEFVREMEHATHSLPRDRRLKVPRIPLGFTRTNSYEFYSVLKETIYGYLKEHNMLGPFRQSQDDALQLPQMYADDFQNRTVLLDSTLLQ